MSTNDKEEPPASTEVDLEDKPEVDLEGKPETTGEEGEGPEKFADEPEKGEDKDHSPWYQKAARATVACVASAWACICGLQIWTTIRESKFCKWMQDHKVWAGVAILLLFLCLVAAILAVTGGDSDEPFMSSTALFGSSPTVDAPMLMAKMSVYPKYEGAEKPHGHVTFRFDNEDNFLMAIHMKGLEKNCDQCKIRIHSGNSCVEERLTPPLWDHVHHRQNPWEHVSYFSHKGLSDTAAIVSTGMNAQELAGHVVIMQDQTHEPIACGVLRQDNVKAGHVRSLYASIERMEPYTMTAVRGEVVVEFFHDNSMLVDFSLLGLPPKCNECKIAIQEGTSCDANAGSHYWDHMNLERDPWATAYGAFYTSDEHGIAERSFFIYNGYGYQDHLDHAVTVRGPDGSRIACGLLKARFQDVVDVTDTPTLINVE